MKIEVLVADVTSVGSLDIVEGDILEVISAGRCFGQFRPFCGRGATSLLFCVLCFAPVDAKVRNKMVLFVLKGQSCFGDQEFSDF